MIPVRRYRMLGKILVPGEVMVVFISGFGVNAEVVTECIGWILVGRKFLLHGNIFSCSRIEFLSESFVDLTLVRLSCLR